jgi:uncharacterized integral membrane protein
MIRKIAATIILLPLAAVIVLLAMTNRQAVTVLFDPLLSGKPAFTATLPLFVIVFLGLLVGVIVGGVAGWPRQRRLRRAARRAEAEARGLRAENETLRQRVENGDRHPASRSADGSVRRLPAA